MLVDQRVRELPLRPRELDAVALDRRGRRAGGAQLLALGYEVRDPGRKRLDGRTGPASPESRRAQGSKGWAACHVPSIGTQTTTV